MFPVFVWSADWGASMIHSAVRGMCYLQRAASDTTQYTHTMTSVKSICFNNTKYTSVTYIQQRCHHFFAIKPGHLLQSQTKHPGHHHPRATPRVDSDPAALPPTSGHEPFLVCFVDNGHVMLSMFHLLLIRLRAAH